MEGQTKVLWDFMEAAYKEGTLDEILKLQQTLAGKNFDNQATVFSDLEDVISEMDDLSPADLRLEQAFAIMPKLKDPEVQEGMRIILAFVNPLAEKIVAKGGGMDDIAGRKEQLAENLRKAGKALGAIASIGADSLKSGANGESVKEYGKGAGKALTRTASFVNEFSEANPDAIPSFMAGVFEGADSEKIRKAMDVLTDGFLDQKPPIIRWSISIMLRRAKRRLLGK